MPDIPPTKPVARFFVDGFNMIFGAQRFFGKSYAAYNLKNMANIICEERGWHNAGVDFFMGPPERMDADFYRCVKDIQHYMKQCGVNIILGQRRYYEKKFLIGEDYNRERAKAASILKPDGQEVLLGCHELDRDGNSVTLLKSTEKGVDVLLGAELVWEICQTGVNRVIVISGDSDLEGLKNFVDMKARENQRSVEIFQAYFGQVDGSSKKFDGWKRIDISQELLEKSLLSQPVFSGINVPFHIHPLKDPRRKIHVIRQKPAKSLPPPPQPAPPSIESESPDPLLRRSKKDIPVIHPKARPAPEAVVQEKTQNPKTKVGSLGWCVVEKILTKPAIRDVSKFPVQDIFAPERKGAFFKRAWNYIKYLGCD